MNRRWLILIFFFPIILFAKELPLKELQLPSGFSISLYANNVDGARQMTLGKNNVVFVGSNEDKVYALIPHSNHSAKILVIASGLNKPSGVSYYQGDLYVAERNQIIKFTHINQHLEKPPVPQIIYQDFPKESYLQMHALKTIGFSPDGWLYVSVGAPCNACISKDSRIATIMRMRPDGTQPEVYAKGVRNSVGFDWHPVTQQLWFTDNGRDWMGDNSPPDKLNYAPQKGLDFGFPYYHGLDKNGNPIADSKFGELKPPQGITWPAWALPAHVAALGMVFYTGNMFPSNYYHQIFIAEHGSWNRSKKIGYRVGVINLENNKAVSYQPFITGWEKNGKYWGRPVGLLVMPDGALLISDDESGVVYRVSYAKM